MDAGRREGSGKEWWGRELEGSDMKRIWSGRDIYKDDIGHKKCSKTCLLVMLRMQGSALASRLNSFLSLSIATNDHVLIT